uniref:Uncharacterized protein LOC114340832 n=1 Tax=Diabrotica virgifera virgifera TaxID=50390 RepID=A0A6P7GN39_DIAVI
IITYRLDRAILSTSNSQARAPTFKSWTYSGEIIRVACDDDEALAWLKKAIDDLKPWEDASLAVVSQDKLPNLTKASVWISEDVTNTSDDTKRVLRRLTAQNPDMSVARWCTFHHEAKTDPNGHLFVFGIGDEDMAVLKKRAMRLSYAFTSLTLKASKQKMEGTSSEPGTSDTRQPDTVTETETPVVPQQDDDHQMVVDEPCRGSTETTKAAASSSEEEMDA